LYLCLIWHSSGNILKSVPWTICVKREDFKFPLYLFHFIPLYGWWGSGENSWRNLPYIAS
jgi:hypothetical protein